MITTADSPGTRRFLAVPAPRRLPVTLAVIASAGVFATSLRALPPAALFPLAAVWLGAFAVGALAPRRGVLILIVLAALTKTVTAALIIWAITQPHSPVGPRDVLDWVPLGLLNASTGLWLLAVIQHRAR
jgi:4-amino-4-deoxy-L-arabinose transferase-like glycosyltransferase